MRQTVRLDKVKAEFNRRLSNPEIDIATKQTLATMIERILMDHNCYEGFISESKDANDLSSAAWWTRTYQ